MMLKIFSNRKMGPAVKLFGFTVKQNMGIVILTVICMLLVCPGFVTLKISDTLSSIGNYAYEFNSVFYFFSVAASLASAVGVVVYNTINFMYLYSKKSSDVFHAIPLTRKQLLLSRSLAGIVCTLIPVLVGYISLTVITLIYPRLIANLEILAVGFFYNILIMAVAWAMSLLFIICAGTVFDFVLSFGIVNAGLLILPLIVLNIASDMLYGYNNNQEAVLKWFSPVYFCGYSVADFILRADTYRIGNHLSRESIWSSTEWTMLFVSLITVVGLTVISVYLYNRRSAESSGNAYAFKFIYVIAGFLLGFEVAYGLGLIFSDLSYNFIFWIFAVIGALLGAVIFGAVCERGFKTVKNSLKIGVASVLAMIAVFVIMGTGGFGYETRVPKAEKVSDVTVRVNGINVGLTEGIGAVTALHKSVVKNYLSPKSVAADEDCDISLMITYNLKNGKMIERSYYAVSNDFADEAAEIARKADIDTQIAAVNADKPRKVYISGPVVSSSSETEEYVNFEIPKEEYIKLLNIYKVDNLKLSPEMLTGEAEYKLYDVYWDGVLWSNDSSLIVGADYKDTVEQLNKLYSKYCVDYDEE